MKSKFVQSLTQTSRLRAVLMDVNILVRTGDFEILKSTPIESPSKSKSSSVYDTSMEISNVSTIQTKYMDKVRQKLGGSLVPFIEANSNKISDAKMLNSSKSLSENPDIKNHNSSLSKWLLNDGMGLLVDYIESRSLVFGIIPRATTSDQVLLELKDQLKDNAVIFPSLSTNKESIVDHMRYFNNKLSSVSILPQNVLLVAELEDMIKQGRNVQYHTCYYR